MESTNAGLSLGRLDQWLQPYFEADMAKLLTGGEAQRIHQSTPSSWSAASTCAAPTTCRLPRTSATTYFGGSSSDQAITLGGVTPDGEDAVNDMTYIFLKVTEMLSIRDPNVNARFNPDITATPT